MTSSKGCILCKLPFCYISRELDFKTKVVVVLQFIINEIFEMMLSYKIVKYFLWCGCEAYDALSLFPRLQKTFSSVWYEMSWKSHTHLMGRTVHNNKIKFSLIANSVQKCAITRSWIYFCACASLTFVRAHPFQERHEWHETFIVFWFAKLFH